MKKTLSVILLMVVVCLSCFQPVFAETILSSTDYDSSEHIHNYSEWIITKKSNILSFGEKKRTCIDCGESEFRYIFFPAIISYVVLASGFVITTYLTRKRVNGNNKEEKELQGYYSKSHLYRSLIYGNGMYIESSDPEVYLNNVAPKDGHAYLLFENVNSGEQYLGKFIHGSAYAEEYKRLILNPIGRDTVVWPFDLIRVEDPKSIHAFRALNVETLIEGKKNEERHHDLIVENIYDDNPSYSECDFSGMFMLFMNDKHSHMKTAEKWLNGISEKNWNNPEIRKFIYSFLTTIDYINKSGYYFFDFHLSRILVDDRGRMLLDFSNLFSHVEYGKTRRQNLVTKNNNFPIESAEPAIFNGNANELDEHSQNYSLTAFIFFLMIGRWPYDGRLLDGYTEDSVQQLYTKFRQYHSMPIFIFDPEDTQNRLGGFDDEQQIISIWESLPEKIKDAFAMTLNQENAERRKDLFALTAEEWIAILDGEQWI